MNRRKFIALLSAVPFVGAFRPTRHVKLPVSDRLTGYNMYPKQREFMESNEVWYCGDIRNAFTRKWVAGSAYTRNDGTLVLSNFREVMPQ